MKKRLVFKGPVLTNSGYGVHCKQIARWLETRTDLDVLYIPTVWGSTSWSIDEKDEKGLVGRIMKKTNVQPNEHFDISIQNVLPNEWETKLAKYNIGVSALVETDIMNPEWIDHINKMDVVIVPSEHSKATVIKTSETFNKVLRTEIHVIPEAFPDEIFSEDIPPLDLDLKTKFNFLMFGQITSNNEESDRKNTYQTLKWLCECFKNDDDVGIIIKTNCSRNTTFDREKTKELLSSYVSKHRKGMYPKINLIHGNLTPKETIGLYKNPSIKAIVSLSKGEGWGLTTLEAAACDVPVIATNWSGHLDYLNLGKFIKCDYDLLEIPKSRVDDKIFMEKSKWAIVRELSTKKAIKKFREESELPKQWAEDLGKKIRKVFSQEQINKKYDIIFNEYINKWYI